MPVIASAKKKLRRDRKRTLTNKKYPRAYKSALKKQQSSKSSKEALKGIYSAIDKTLKKKIVHKRKANRLKSKAARFLKNLPREKKKETRKKT